MESKLKLEFMVHRSVVTISVILACGFITLVQGASSSQVSFTKYQMLSNGNTENIFNEYFLKIAKTYLRKREPRHIIVISESVRHLERAKVLFENRPYIVCTEMKKCIYSVDITSGTFFVIFKNHFSKEMNNKTIQILANCRICNVLIIYEGILDKSELHRVIKMIIRQNLSKLQFVHHERNGLKFYSTSYEETCSVQINSLGIWTPGSTLDITSVWLTSPVRNMHRCPIVVSTANFTPNMVIKDHGNGSIDIIGGVEGKMILTIAEHLNFTIVARTPSEVDRLKYDSRQTAIGNEVATRKADIGIGRLRPLAGFRQKTEFSVPYGIEYIAWSVPQTIIFAGNIMWVEFSWQAWASVAIIFIVACVLGYAYHKVYSLIQGTRSKEFISTVLDMIAIHLGNPVIYAPQFVGGKYLLIILLSYAVVMGTAYKAALAAIMTTFKGTPEINNVEAILRANLSVGGTSYEFGFLRDQAIESELSLKLMNRFQVIADRATAKRRRETDDNFACLGQISTLWYERQEAAIARKPITYNILQDHTSVYFTVLIFRKQAPLREPMNAAIQRLTEFGVMRYWDIHLFDADEIIRDNLGTQLYFRSTKAVVETSFSLYAYCIALCLLTFLIELCTRKP